MSMNYQWCYLMCWSVFLLITSGLTFTAGAQTLFTRPDTIPNYAAYQYVDECIAAVSRLTREVEIKDPVWRDTTEFDLSYSMRAVPENAVSMGARCLEKVSVDTLPLEDVHLWAAALLMVNRDTDVQRLYSRLFDSLSEDLQPEAFGNMFATYGNAHPPRVEILKTLYTTGLARIPQDSVFWGIGFRIFAASFIRQGGDKAFVNQVIRETLEFLDTIPAQVKARQEYKLLVSNIFFKDAQDATEAEGIDSLLVSTASYRRYLKHLWSRMMLDPLNSPVGMAVPPLGGDFWFQSDSSLNETSGAISYHKIAAETRPVPGQINMIVFLQGGCHDRTVGLRFGRGNGGHRCWPMFAAIRRMKQAYPQLVITVASKTYGSLGNAPPIPPEEEADTLAKYFLGFHHLPATMVVSMTKYFRLAGLDQRRIDTETTNEQNYTINGFSLAKHKNVLLIDQAGKIFYTGSITGLDEGRLLGKLNAVFNRDAP